MKKRWLPSCVVPSAATLVCALSMLLLQIIGCKPSTQPPPDNQASATKKAAPDGGGNASHPPPTAARPPQVAAHPSKEHARSVQRNPASVVASDDETLDQQVAKLQQGNLAYNTPTTMKTGQTVHVIARIGSGSVSVSTLESGMPSGPGTQTVATSTPISTKMKMSLTSADFDITPLSTQEQFIADNTPTSWEWEITPKHSGTLSLHLAATVELNDLSKDFAAVDRTIAVQVDPVNAAENFFQANAVWALGVIGAAIASIWTWLKKRKKPQSPA